METTLINLGTMLASGISVAPAGIARLLDASLQHLSVRVGGGIFCVLGALSIAALEAMMPTTGGIYVYLERVY